MTVDYPGAIDVVNEDPNYVFSNALADVSNSDLTIINHKTASGRQTTALAIARYLHNNTAKVSAHFVIGKDGSIFQVVRLKDGAGANCCTSIGYNAGYWDRLIATYGNLNRCTISIEHEDWTDDNSDPMPQAQIDASNKLNLWLVQRYSLTRDQIHSHASIDPVNRARCPGLTFSFSQLFLYISRNSVNYRMRAADDTWNSILFNGVRVPKDTGIAQAWYAKYQNEGPLPPPSTLEFESHDWDGNKIVVQIFGNLRCEWNGSPTWITTL